MFRLPSLLLRCLYPVLAVWCPQILWRFALWYIHFLLLWCDHHHTHKDSCTKQKHSITHHALKHHSHYSRQDSCMHLTAAHSPAIRNTFMYAGKSNENVKGYFSGLFGASRFATAFSFATRACIYHTQYLPGTNQHCWLAVPTAPQGRILISVHLYSSIWLAHAHNFHYPIHRTVKFPLRFILFQHVSTMKWICP